MRLINCAIFCYRKDIFEKKNNKIYIGLFRFLNFNFFLLMSSLHKIIKSNNNHFLQKKKESI